MPSLKNALMFIFAVLAGMGLYMVLSENPLGPWLLVPGVIGCIAAAYTDWSLSLYPEFWEMLKDYFNCRWC